MRVLRFLAVAFLALGGVSSVDARAASPRVIFGEDDRRNVDEAENPEWARWADSTVAFFDRSKIDVKGKRAFLHWERYGRKFGLCRDERFFDEPSGSDFSGVLIAPDLVLTAAHAVRSPADCDRFLAVFGFSRKNGAGSEAVTVPVSEVYACESIVQRENSSKGDYAVLKLSRRVVGHRPLPLHAGKVPVGTKLVVIGHPNGLPAKIAGGARVRSNRDSAFLEADTDTANGNSGSPVFDARTGRIVGILVDGSVPDFRRDPLRLCKRSSVCAQDQCGSEIITRATAVRIEAGMLR